MLGAPMVDGKVAPFWDRACLRILGETRTPRCRELFQQFDRERHDEFHAAAFEGIRNGVTTPPAAGWRRLAALMEDHLERTAGGDRARAREALAEEARRHEELMRRLEAEGGGGRGTAGAAGREVVRGRGGARRARVMSRRVYRPPPAAVTAAAYGLPVEEVERVIRALPWRRDRQGYFLD
jgi:hypothetical protein